MYQVLQRMKSLLEEYHIEVGHQQTELQEEAFTSDDSLSANVEGITCCKFTHS